jgi:hypothetical protein
MITKVTGNEQCSERSGTYRGQMDGEDVWVAYVQLGRHKNEFGEPLYLVVEGYGPSEVQAAERCMTKCKMLGDIMTLAIQEGFWAPMRRAEAAARNKAFSSALGKPASIIFAEDDDDKKDEPS